MLAFDAKLHLLKPSEIRLHLAVMVNFEATFRFPDTPLVLMVRNDHPAKNVKDLYDFAKKNPDQVFMGNAGLGSSSHLIAALVANAAGADVKHVPYKGAGPALIDVVGPLTGVTAGVPPVQSGIAPLASATGSASAAK